VFQTFAFFITMDGQFYQLPYEERERITQKEYRVVSGIKIIAFGESLGLELEEMKAIVKTKDAHGLKVTAPNTGGASMVHAIETGVDGIIITSVTEA
jgi:hypothetical protein